MSAPSANRVRQLREARGLSQIALAAAAQLTRQSIGAVEAGRATPAVDVALRIAKALECTVEQLFDVPAQAELVSAELVGEHAAGRMAVAHLNGRWLAYPLLGEGLRTSADAIAGEATRQGVTLELVRPPAAVRENIVVAGCAAALGLLSDRLNSHGGPGRFFWLSRSSTDALGLLSNHRAHIAGVHLVDPKTGDANVQDVRRLVRGTATSLITLARWEVGLLTQAGNPKRLRSGADLGKRGVRLAIREPGSGVRRLLERELRAASAALPVVGSKSPRIEVGSKSPHIQVNGHLDVAHSVSVGAADAGIATRDVAIVYGLEFIPLAEERFDLVVPQELIEDPRVQRLLDTLTTSGLRRELTALGYDVRACGDRVAELPA